ncbi:MAG: hypothetical protein P4L51_03905 [Puia sp.]|nr:hypothetical protein [Puia sp.]
MKGMARKAMAMKAVALNPTITILTIFFFFLCGVPVYAHSRRLSEKSGIAGHRSVIDRPGIDGSVIDRSAIDRSGRSSPIDTNLILYGRGLYPGDDSTFENIKTSGFTTVVLSSFYIHANGDLYSGDSRSPIIHNGEYVGDKDWLKRVASLKQGVSSVRRIEILLEGRWINQPPNTFDFIKDWTDPSNSAPGIATGTGRKSTLYELCKVLKKTIGADAICVDDESVYDSPSIVLLGKMAHKLHLHMTLCPFKNAEYWKAILTGSHSTGSRRDIVDAVYLQCYDGGKNNVPGQWVKDLATDIPVYPIFLCRGSFGVCGAVHNGKTPDEIKTEMAAFKKDYPGLAGGAIWQMADIKSYIRRNCAVQDPSSGSATSTVEYLAQLRNSLKDGL